jgi:hypothetical protein
MTRRDWLLQSYLGLGGIALAGRENPLAPKVAHWPARAKSCIFLFLEGGVEPDGPV